MNHSIMKKTVLASAMAVTFVGFNAHAAPSSIPITNMQFSTTNYAAGGSLNSAGTGAMNSVDPFFYHTWTGAQQTGYLTNADVWNDGVLPSVQGPYDYDATLAAMTDDQVAVGIFFNWNGQNEIAVLEIFDCDASDNCTGNGVAMANGPFAGSVAIFNAGLSCESPFEFTPVDTPLSFDIAEDLLGNDAASIADDGAAKCANPTLAAAADVINPPGLAVDSVSATSANGGTVVINGSVVDYTPAGGYEGPDSFTFTVSDASTAAPTVVQADIQVGGKLASNFTMMGATGGTFGGTNDVEFEWNGSYNSSAVDAKGILADTDFDANISIFSGNPFLNFNWTAHHIRIFEGPGTFKFDVTCEAIADYDMGVVDCGRALTDQGAKTRYMTMTLEAGEIGGHMLFDWGSSTPSTDCGQANCDIDVVNTWKVDEEWEGYDDTSPKNDVWIGAAGVPPATDENSVIVAKWELVSTDVKGYTDISGVLHTEGNEINGAPMLDGAFIDNYANFNKTPDLEGVPPEPIDTEISDVSTNSFSFSIWTLMAGLLSVFGLRRVTRNK